MVIESAVFSSLLVLFTSTLIFYIIRDLYRKRRIFGFSWQLQGYNFYPIIGNGYHIIGKDVFDVFRDLAAKFQLPCNLWIGHDYYYVTADAAEIKVIVNHPNAFDKGESYKSFNRLLANTLPTEPVKKWRKDRRILSKSFNQRLLNSLVESHQKNSNGLVERLKDSQSKNTFDVFVQFSIENFEGGIGGLQVQHKNNRLSRYFAIYQKIAARRINNPIVPEPLFLITSEGKLLTKSIDEIRSVIQEILDVKRRTTVNKVVDPDLDDDEVPLLDLMLKHEKTYTDEEMFRHMITFMLGAAETSAFTLVFTVTLLGMNPECQEKVYEEVVQTVGIDNPVTHEHLPKLKYSERVLFESMRLFPAVPFIARHATTDIDLGTKILPADSNILINIFELHRSEKYWKDPLKFDPDRFLPEEVAKRDSHCFIPFSAGPRNCIGMKYASMVMLTAMANVVRKYKITSNHKSVNDIRLTSSITMKAVPDVDCQFTPREHQK